MAFMLSPLLKRYTWNSAWLYYARIFIALCGTTAFPWWLGDVKLTIPLTLGMVAAALTDLDDRLAGRLRNLIITLFCFFIASASVELLFPWPWLFAIGLTLSTSGFILLGGLGQRYATIAFGALLIAIYTMLGTSLYEHWYQQPMYLLAGAVWYNVLTLIVIYCSRSARCRTTWRVAMNNWRVTLSSSHACLILILKMKARHRCTIWLSPTVS